MWKQLEIYADKHYSIFQDVEPLYPSDSNQMYFYKEALLAKNDYRSLKSCLESVKHLGEEESLKDANAIKIKINQLCVTLYQTIAVSKGLLNESNFLYALAFSPLSQYDDTGKIKIDQDYINMTTNFIKTLPQLYNKVDYTSKKFDTITTTHMQDLIDIDLNNENKTDKIYGIIIETFGSEEFKDYVESTMAYLEAKYLMCCMVLRLTASNSYKNITPNISNNK